MLDGSHYVECACGSDEHTMRFVLNKDEKEIYLNVFLHKYGFFKRVWTAIKYVFGYRCKYGHFDCALLWEDNVDQLQKMIDDFKKIYQFNLAGQSDDPRGDDVPCVNKTCEYNDVSCDQNCCACTGKYEDPYIEICKKYMPEKPCR